MVRPSRRYLLWLLLAIFATCVALVAVVSPEYWIAQERREAVEAVTARGGIASYNWQLEDKMGPSELKDFVREIAGNPALFAYVEHVDLTGSRFTDEDLVILEPFVDAKWIVIGDAKVTDDGMTALSRKLPQCRIRR